MSPAVVDRLLDDGHAFGVCYCGQLVHFGGCDVCGYELPARRAQREQAAVRDMLDEWKRAARAATARRRFQRWARRRRYQRQKART
jgi:hypothetical protein